MAPEVSIVMATFNKAEALARTLRSIRSQRVPFDYEIVVVDDGSTDGTRAVCETYGTVYAYLDRPTYLNPGPPRNVGYRLARAPVVIAQSDDVEHVTPDGVAVMRDGLLPESVLFAQVYNVSPGGQIVADYCGPNYQRPLLFLGAVWRTDIFAIGGNDEDFEQPGYEDDWFTDCLRCGLRRRFLFTDRAVGYHHDHPRPPSAEHLESRVIYNRKRATAVAADEAGGPNLWTASTGPWI